MKNNFIIIISNTLRSIEYLKELKLKKISPTSIIYLNNGKKNRFSKILEANNFFFSCIIKKYLSSKINNKISNYILRQKSNIVIFSGYPGDKIKDKFLLSKKKFLHSHPGKLPDYKGSTTIYYSLLKEKKIFCSTLILNHKLDSGKNLLTKIYKTPKKIFDIDCKYDSKIRAINMIETLLSLKNKRLKNNKNKNKNKKNKNKNKKNKNKKINNKNNLYFVIHPVLRSIVFKKRKIL